MTCNVFGGTLNLAQSINFEFVCIFISLNLFLQFIFTKRTVICSQITDFRKLFFHTTSNKLVVCVCVW